MDKYFIISYRKKVSEEATIDQNCKDDLLGIGLKDICLYLRKMDRSNFPMQSSSDGELHITWIYDPQKYSELTTTEFVHELEDIKSSLISSENIEKQMNVKDFMLDKVDQNIDDIIVYVQENGVNATIEKYKKEIDFLLGDLGKNEIVRNDVSIKPFSFSFSDTQKVLQNIYDHIPPKIKKKFGFQIDFTDLTCSGNE